MTSKCDARFDSLIENPSVRHGNARFFRACASSYMIESMYGHYVGKRAAARIDVAREQTIQAIRNLDRQGYPGALRILQREGAHC